MKSWLVCSSFLACAGASLVACRSKAPPEPVSEQSQPSQAAQGKTDEPAQSTSKPKAPTERSVAAKPVSSVAASAGDPHEGKFTLEEATRGLSGKGALQATITTDLGALECELYEDEAPITVATFVGLARGTRAWKQGGQWVKKPLYDGTVFHRVIKGFMIQGGDPNGNGSGGPGFVIPDEIWENAKHDQRGLLCMANRGPNTNGSQFFILDGKASHLDGGYTIFGKCAPESVIEKLASVEVQGDRAVKPPTIRSVTIQRAP